MMLERIKVKKLFHTFDYDIELKDEGTTILTGPNGYGKTTILKMLYALASKNPFIFFGVPFENVQLEFSDRDTVTVSKNADDELGMSDGKRVFGPLGKKELVKILRRAMKGGPFHQMDDEHWMDMRTETLVSLDTAFERLSSDMPGAVQIDLFEAVPGYLDLPEFPNAYLIREQRLLRPASTNARGRYRHHISDDYPTDSYVETVEEYAREVSKEITSKLAESSQISQELDSSFPRRLFEETSGVSEGDFNERFERMKNRQNTLSKYGLSVIQDEDHPTYKEENSKALLVYLGDAEKKLDVFSDLFDRLNTFAEILEERQFANKSIEISKEEGFRFVTEQGQSLPLSSLSSGEKQEVVLFYELLFKVEPGTLVLIDEPEISLHVAWQKEFLNDLLDVVRLQGINVIMATHSPQIINERWDLTVDLKEISG